MNTYQYFNRSQIFERIFDYSLSLLDFTLFMYLSVCVHICGGHRSQFSRSSLWSQGGNSGHWPLWQEEWLVVSSHWPWATIKKKSYLVNYGTEKTISGQYLKQLFQSILSHHSLAANRGMQVILQSGFKMVTESVTEEAWGARQSPACLQGLCVSACLQVPALLEFLSWLPPLRCMEV